MSRYVKVREGSVGDGYTRWLDVEEVVVPGPPGPAGAIESFEQSFSESTSWIVNHNLGRRPSRRATMRQESNSTRR